MPAKRTTMRKIRDIFRLRQSAGLTIRQINASTKTSIGAIQKLLTTSDYLTYQVTCPSSSCEVNRDFLTSYSCYGIKLTRSPTLFTSSRNHYPHIQSLSAFGHVFQIGNQVIQVLVAYNVRFKAFHTAIWPVSDRLRISYQFFQGRCAEVFCGIHWHVQIRPDTGRALFIHGMASKTIFNEQPKTFCNRIIHGQPARWENLWIRSLQRVLDFKCRQHIRPFFRANVG